MLTTQKLLDHQTTATLQYTATQAILDPNYFVAVNRSGIIDVNHLFKNCISFNRKQLIDDFVDKYSKRLNSSDQMRYLITQQEISKILIDRKKQPIHSGDCYFIDINELIDLIPWYHKIPVCCFILDSVCCDQMHEKIKQQLTNGQMSKYSILAATLWKIVNK